MHWPPLWTADVKEAFQSVVDGPVVDGNPVYTIWVLAYKLSPEFQDRQRHPLFELAQIMTSSVTVNHWIVDENLTPMRLSRQHAFRLLMHNQVNMQARGFIYVSDTNGLVFMLVATVTVQPNSVQSAVENMKITQAEE